MSYGVFELQGGLFAWFAHKVLTSYPIVWKLDIELKLQCCEQISKRLDNYNGC